MRRTSDHREGERTGVGRRARDRILAGETRPGLVLRQRRELDNLILFLGDDLRESALAMGGIESFLLRAKELIEKPDLKSDELKRLLDDEELRARFDLLWDALSSLRRSISAIQQALK